MKLTTIYTLSSVALAGAELNTKKIKISSDDAKKIGQQIYVNECSGKPENLVHWKDGEEFVSVGICHAIWCAKDKCGIFQEAFPELREFLVKNGVNFPKEFLGKSPWNEAKEVDQNSELVRKLRTMMLETIDLQTEFAITKLKGLLPKLLKQATQSNQANIRIQFNRMTDSGLAGIYALVDYLNFKGAGAKERYKNCGWGLQQVLEDMKGQEKGPDAIAEFANSAERLLELRVKNAPRPESQWLPGWKNRINTYRKF